MSILSSLKNATSVLTPVEVLVHWSESKILSVKEVIFPFAIFEQMANKAASLVNMGYDKTEITVRFESGEKYTCRIDLAVNDEKGFRDHCMKMIDFFADFPEKEPYLNFIRRIKWPE
ncbi:LPD25 domain-containing protein [Photorhabdus sp. RM71S]|uniref:LPD25 domain-containing protein n=1 Tax=Photorhabdus sp. RM71S TaxID=3342824 RepID=UPI0036DCA396